MSLTSATSSLAAVATRIQERNNALRSELATLELLKSQQEQAHEYLKADQLASTEIRKELLTAVRSRHGLEFECIQTKEFSNTIEKITETVQSKLEEVRRRSEELKRKFDEEQAPIYAAHAISTKIYSVQSEELFVRAQRRKQQREDLLKQLIDKTRRQREEASEMRAERQRIREECLEMDRREEEEDEETMALNLQVKSIIAKVRRLVCVGAF